MKKSIAATTSGGEREWERSNIKQTFPSLDFSSRIAIDFITSIEKKQGEKVTSIPISHTLLSC